MVDTYWDYMFGHAARACKRTAEIGERAQKMVEDKKKYQGFLDDFPSGANNRAHERMMSQIQELQRENANLKARMQGIDELLELIMGNLTKHRREIDRLHRKTDKT